MSTYLAFIIGPVYGTILKARRTRELWAASYMFSYLMKQITKELNTYGTVLIPQGPSKEPKNLGVGLYPDSIILEANREVDLDYVIPKVQQVKETFIDKIINDLLTKTSTDQGTSIAVVKDFKSDVLKSFLNDYFKVVGVQASLDDLHRIASTQEKSAKPLKDVEAITKGCSFLLSQLELRPSLAHLDPDPIRAFLSLANQSFLKLDAMASSIERFPSLYEIATQELRYVDLRMSEQYTKFFDAEFDQLVRSRIKGDRAGLDSTEEDKVIDLYKQLGNKGFKGYLSEYHRYVAYVHADGDGIGKVIGAMGGSADLVSLSGRLTEFGVKTSTALGGVRFSGNDILDHGWGAVPIFIGGDDLLALSPVVSRALGESPETVFSLVDLIDKIFAHTVSNGLDIPTLSFGICISYVKYPMREANSNAHELLTSVKSDRYKLRNRLHIKLIKHSGSSFEAVYYRGKASHIADPNSLPFASNVSDPKVELSVWERTLLLIEEYGVPRYIFSKNKAGSNTFLNSIIAEVREQRTLLVKICSDVSKIKAWFENNFDEPNHYGYRETLFYELAKYLVAGYHQAQFLAREEPTADPPYESDKQIDQAFDEFLDCFYMTLRFIQFVRGHDEP